MNYVENAINHIGNAINQFHPHKSQSVSFFLYMSICARTHIKGNWLDFN